VGDQFRLLGEYCKQLKIFVSLGRMSISNILFEPLP
jgi:hypothetical protein